MELQNLYYQADTHESERNLFILLGLWDNYRRYTPGYEGNKPFVRTYGLVLSVLNVYILANGVTFRAYQIGLKDIFTPAKSYTVIYKRQGSFPQIV